MVQKFRTRSSQLYDNFIDYALHLTDGWQLNLRHVLRLYYSFNTPNPPLLSAPSANNVAAFQAYIFYSNNLREESGRRRTATNAWMAKAAVDDDDDDE